MSQIQQHTTKRNHKNFVQKSNMWKPHWKVTIHVCFKVSFTLCMDTFWWLSYLNFNETKETSMTTSSWLYTGTWKPVAGLNKFYRISYNWKVYFLIKIKVSPLYTWKMIIVWGSKFLCCYHATIVKEPWNKKTIVGKCNEWVRISPNVMIKMCQSITRSSNRGTHIWKQAMKGSDTKIHNHSIYGSSSYTVNSEINVCIYYCHSLKLVQNVSLITAISFTVVKKGDQGILL